MRLAPTKDPEDTVDYGFDWTDELAGDDITASTWSVVDAALDDASFTATHTTVWLSGGAAGTTIYATNTISTALGRVLNRTLQIPCDER